MHLCFVLLINFSVSLFTEWPDFAAEVKSHTQGSDNIQTRHLRQQNWEQTTPILDSSGTEFTYSKERERMHKIQSLAMTGPPCIAHQLPIWQKRYSCIHPLLQQKNHDISHSWGLKYRNWGHAWGPLTHVFKKKKRVHTESEIGKYDPTESNKPSTNRADSISLGKDVSQAQGPFLCDWASPKGYMHETAFPNTFISF